MFLNPKHLLARSRFGEGRRNPKFETNSKDQNKKYDKVVKSRKNQIIVIPAKAGIQ
jgi:hypothetical protein